jgi:integral membrane protein
MASGKRAKALQNALLRYRILAYATGVFLLLLTFHIVLQGFQAQDTGESWFSNEGMSALIPGTGHAIPMIHGWLYLIYVIVAVDLWMRTRLPALGTVGVVLAGTIPVMSFVAERWVTRRVQPMVGAVKEKQPGTVPS